MEDTYTKLIEIKKLQDEKRKNALDKLIKMLPTLYDIDKNNKNLSKNNVKKP